MLRSPGPGTADERVPVSPRSRTAALTTALAAGLAPALLALPAPSLAGPSLAGPLPTGPVPTAVSAQAAAESSGPKQATVWVPMKIGGAKVRAPRARLRITFSGRRGQLVGLESNGRTADGATLRRLKGRRTLGARVSSGGQPVWTLPRHGSYVFTYTQRARRDVQLLDVRRTVLAGAEHEQLVPASGRRYWVEAQVPSTGAALRVGGTRRAAWQSVHTSTRPQGQNIASRLVALLPGHAPMHVLGDSLYDSALPAVRTGERVWFYTTGGTASISPAVHTGLSVDGTPVPLAGSLMMVSTLDVPVDSFLQTTSEGLADGEQAVARLLDEPRALSFPQTVWTGLGGTRTLVTVVRGEQGQAPPESSSKDATFALRSVKMLPPLPAPGPGTSATVDFTPDHPGQWVAAPMNVTNFDFRVTSTPGPGWSMHLRSLFTWDCGPEAPNGCGDATGTTLSGVNTYWPGMAMGIRPPAFALLQLPSATSGTTTLTIENTSTGSATNAP